MWCQAAAATGSGGSSDPRVQPLGLEAGTVLGSSGGTWEAADTASGSDGRTSQPKGREPEQNREKGQCKSSRPVYPLCMVL